MKVERLIDVVCGELNVRERMCGVSELMDDVLCFDWCGEDEVMDGSVGVRVSLVEDEDESECFCGVGLSEVVDGEMVRFVEELFDGCLRLLKIGGVGC